MITATLFLFDLDGTLIDSRVDIAHAVNLTFRDLGLPPKPEELIYGYVGHGVRQLIVDAVESEEPALIDRALAQFEGHYLAHLLDTTCLYPGIADILAGLPTGRVAIVTNKPLNYTLKILEGLKITDRFDLILGGTPGRRMKPDPQMVIEALTTLQVDPADAVFIGDSTADIGAARAAGVRSCAVGYGLSPVEEVQAASPDFFAATVADLAALIGARPEGKQAL